MRNLSRPRNGAWHRPCLVANGSAPAISPPMWTTCHAPATVPGTGRGSLRHVRAGGVSRSCRWGGLSAIAAALHGWRAADATSLHSSHGPGARASQRLRTAAQAAAAAHRLDRPGRRRGARRRARQAVDQEGREGLGARACAPLRRPDDPRGPGHTWQGRCALLEGDPARPERPERSIRRRDLRLPEPRSRPPRNGSPAAG